jgi:hypothetical protein
MVERWVRLKLLGDGWRGLGGYVIPHDKVIVITEAEAAAFLRDRGSARSVEVLGWMDAPDATEPHQQAD